MYKVEYLPPATADILEIEAYLYELSPTAADRFTETLLEKTATLEEYPLIYPVYENDPYFRRMVIMDHLLFYSVDEKRSLVVVHRVIYGKRDISLISLEH